ncbi:MAG: N-acetyl-gamma-glutamyl-phosphate reductase [Candidatus Omnitrophota bacterium]
MIRVGIVGISGYSGFETLRILLNHPHARVTYVSANNTTGPVEEIWPQLTGQTKLYCDKFHIQHAVEQGDVFFLAIPHTVAMKIVPDLLAANKKVIDISADYRLKSSALYKKWYGVEHLDPKNLKKAVYGLPELYREKIKKTDLIANPGCYPTAALLGLLPLVSTNAGLIKTIIIDAKSGTSGAGRKVSTSLLFSEVNENFKAYKVLTHQHTPEINQYLTAVAKKNIDVSFVAHLLPVTRGILATIYAELAEPLSLTELHRSYSRFYKTERFVRLLNPGAQPEIKNVNGTNYCDIGLAVKKNLVVITCAIDNLLKGAAGQAVQNMNIMHSFKEDEGLL